MRDTINRHISMITKSDYEKHVNTSIKTIVKLDKETRPNYMFPVRVPFKCNKTKHIG